MEGLFKFITTGVLRWAAAIRGDTTAPRPEVQREKNPPVSENEVVYPFVSYLSRFYCVAHREQDRHSLFPFETCSQGKQTMSKYTMNELYLL